MNRSSTQTEPFIAPSEDKTVSIEFKVTDCNKQGTKRDCNYCLGTHTATADENSKPAVLPKLAEGQVLPAISSTISKLTHRGSMPLTKIHPSMAEATVDYKTLFETIFPLYMK